MSHGGRLYAAAVYLLGRRSSLYDATVISRVGSGVTTARVTVVSVDLSVPPDAAERGVPTDSEVFPAATAVMGVVDGGGVVVA